MNKKTAISTLLKSQSGRIISSIIFTILTSTAMVSIGIVIKEIIDTVVPNIDVNLPLYIVLLSGVLAFWFLFDLIRRGQIINVGNNITKDLIESSYDLLLNADVASLEKFDKAVLEDNIIKYSSEIGDGYISKHVLGFICDSIFLIGIFIGMMITIPIMGLIIFLTLPVDFLIIHGLKKYEKHLKEKKRQKENDGAVIFEDTLANLKNYKLKNGLGKEKEKFTNWLEDYKKTENLYLYNKGLSKGALFYLIVGLVLTAVFGTGIWLLRAGGYNVTLGEIICVAALTPFTFIFFNRIINYEINPSNVKEAQDFLNEISIIKTEKRSETIEKLEDILVMRFADVAYKNKDLNIDVSNLSFEIKRGEKLGILIFDNIENSNIISELFTKIIRPSMGTVSINNCDINKVSTPYLREMVSLLSSNDKLIKKTIMENIVYPYEFDEYKYNDALNKSGLRSLINDGVIKDTDEVTDEIDGFLKQQILAASCFYKDSKIFVVNYAFNDVETKKMEPLIKEIYNLKNKILIMITTKVFNVINCDKILIVDKNGGVEYGKYSELIQNKESMLYTSMRKIRTNRKVS